MQVEVSVLIRTFNSAKTVERAVKSAVSQIFSKGFEVVVVDDGSSDKTIEWAKKAGGNKLRIKRLDHVGAIPALNIGLKGLEGKYYTILDGDDALEPEALASLAEPMAADTSVAFTYGDYYEVARGSKRKRLVKTGDNIFNTLAGGLMFERETVVGLGRYDEGLFFPEYDLLIKLQREGIKGVHVAKVVYDYFRRGGSVTSDASAVEKGKEQLQTRYGRGFPIRDY